VIFEPGGKNIHFLTHPPLIPSLYQRVETRSLEIFLLLPLSPFRTSVSTSIISETAFDYSSGNFSTQL
jgi:hypothetical protein